MKTVYIGIFLSLMSISAIAQELNAKITPQGILVLEGDQKVLYYQKETKSMNGQYARANYIHPLYDLHGNSITEDFPEDHMHHRGVFWAWHQVLVAGKHMGDSWECSDFTWEVKNATTANVSNKLLLAIKTLWSSPDYVVNGLEVPFVEENTKVTIHPMGNNHRIIDFEISLLALIDDVQIGGSEDVKGYGGFSARLKLPSDIQFNSEGKKIIPKNEAIQAGREVQLDGTLNPDQKLGVLMVASKSNPEPNNSWILRSENSMQNAVYPGAKPVTVSQNTPTILKYRMVIYNGNPSKKQLRLWNNF